MKDALYVTYHYTTLHLTYSRLYLKKSASQLLCVAMHFNFYTKHFTVKEFIEEITSDTIW